MSVAHVFTETDVGDHEEIGALCLYRPDSILDDAVGLESGSSFFVFGRGNAEKQHRLKAEVEGTLRLVCDFLGSQLKNSRHAGDSASALQLVANEQRQNEIVRAEFRFANKVS